MEQLAMAPLATEMKEWFRQQFQENREANEKLVENQANKLTKHIGRVFEETVKRQTSDLSKNVAAQARQIQVTSKEDISQVRMEISKLFDVNMQTQQIQRRTREEISDIKILHEEIHQGMIR